MHSMQLPRLKGLEESMGASWKRNFISFILIISAIIIPGAVSAVLRSIFAVEALQIGESFLFFDSSAIFNHIFKFIERHFV